MNNRLKNQTGFTLVEVIVVAVIVAILASIATPIYLNYIQNSRANQANNIAGTVANFCSICIVDGGLCNVSRNATINSPGEASCNVNTSTISLPQGFNVDKNCDRIRVTSLADGTIRSTDYYYK